MQLIASILPKNSLCHFTVSLIMTKSSFFEGSHLQKTPPFTWHIKSNITSASRIYLENNPPC
jgi:hypothetical protein